MEQRAAIKFCVKLEKSATETFAMCEKATERNVVESTKGKGAENSNAKIPSEDNAHCFF